MFFFIGPAYADGAQSAGGWAPIVPLLAAVGLFYFLALRPNQKRAKQHRELLATIKRGDKVITNCGLKATVAKVVDEQEVVLEIASNVHCRFMKSAISSVNSGVPAAQPATKEVPSSEADQPRPRSEKRASKVLRPAKARKSAKK